MFVVKCICEVQYLPTLLLTHTVRVLAECSSLATGEGAKQTNKQTVC